MESWALLAVALLLTLTQSAQDNVLAQFNVFDF
jgi:hypothetical protein